MSHKLFVCPSVINCNFLSNANILESERSAILAGLICFGQSNRIYYLIYCTSYVLSKRIASITHVCASTGVVSDNVIGS